MDLVVRTSHGEAEITLRLDGESRTLGDVVARVTGRAAPITLYVDGRAAPASTPLDEVGLLTGSVISTDDETEPVPAGVALDQIAGPGAGATAWLSVGRHVIGPGRRVSTADLGPAPVDEPVFELEVGSERTVDLVIRRPPARLDGEQLEIDRSVPWRDELLDVAGRVFRLRRHDPTPPTRNLARSRVAFNRPPRPAVPPEPAPLDAPDGGRRTRRRFTAGPARHGSPDEFTAAVRVRAAEERDRRRAAQPDPVSALRNARSTDPRLWERRPGDPDAFQVPVGLADLAWAPRLAGSDPGRRTGDGLGSLPMVPVVLDLLRERCVGVTGSADFTAAVTRGLVVLAATTHGPADLDIVVLTGPDRAHAWEWAKWLPHTRVGGPPRLLLTHGQVTGWVSAIRAGAQPPSASPPTHLTLVVVDEPAWWRERASPLRPLFAEKALPLRFVALTDTADDVPSMCTTVISQDADGASVDHPSERRRLEDVHPYVVSPRLALEVARALAPLDDPELPMSDPSMLPTSVAILDLLDIADPTASAVIERWAPTGSPRVTHIGVTETGAATVDLFADGPHALVAGTPGSGMAGLLRTAVASLAVEFRPDDVAVVLVDPGRRFDRLARLPHTVARITEVHAHGIARLLRCLRAELRHRAQVLHPSGEFTAGAPLPRLVVVIDELDTLVGELPEFAAALADLARRGPDLGLHVVLATRRPAGAVDAASGAMVDVRIALRLQEEGDSIAVIGSDDAVLLPDHVPGRALLRIGTRELLEFQSADDAGVTGTDIDVRPFVVGRDLLPMEQRLERTLLAERTRLDGSTTDLGRLVTAIRGAVDRLGLPAARRPVPDPLPDRLSMRDFFDEHPGDGVPFGLADLPDEQQRAPVWWSPVGPAGAATGSRLAFGAPGSGTSSLLATLLLGVAERFSPDDVHLYGIDADGDLLAPLAALPHTGAVVGRDDVERVVRLLHLLTAELERRSASAEQIGDTAAVPAHHPAIVLAVHDLGSLRDALDGRPDLEAVWPRLEAIVREGPSRGCSVLITARDERDVPPALAGAMSDRLVFELGDRSAYSAFDLRPVDIPEFVPGRAVRQTDRVELQIAEPPESWETAVAAVDPEPALERPPLRVDPLPDSISVDELARHAEATDRGCRVPVGLDTRSGEPALLPLTFGEHVFVTGPAGAGRSSLLVAIATAVGNTAPAVALFAAAPRGGPLTEIDGDVDTIEEQADVSGWVERIIAARGRRLVLVDDADLLEDPALGRLASLRDDQVSVVVAGRSDDLRAADHWSKPLRRFRTGVVLKPTPGDGDLLRVSLGARLPRFVAHTGFLIDDGDVVPLLAVVSALTAFPEPT